MSLTDLCCGTSSKTADLKLNHRGVTAVYCHLIKVQTVMGPNTSAVWIFVFSH